MQKKLAYGLIFLLVVVIGGLLVIAGAETNGYVGSDLDLTDVNLFFDGGKVGIGTTDPDTEFVVEDAASGGSYGANAKVAIESNGNAFLQFSSTTGLQGLYFGDDASGTVGGLFYDHLGDFMRFDTSGSEKVRIDSSGNVGIGTDGPMSKLHVEFDDAKFLFDGSESTSGYTTQFKMDNQGLKIGHNSNIRNIEFFTENGKTSKMILTPKGVLKLPRTSKKVIEFDGGDSMITVHDGFGNFNFKAGVDEDNKIIKTFDAKTGGASHIEMDESGAITIAVTNKDNEQTFTDDVYVQVHKNGKITMKGDIRASSNVRNNCAWSACTDGPVAFKCPAGKFLQGLHVPGASSGCGDADDYRFYCCEI